jgi:hypothetical protein
MKGSRGMKSIFKKTRNIKIALIIGIIMIVGLFTIPYVNNFRLELKQKNEIKTISQKLSQDTSNKLKPAEYYDETKIYDIMHKMANTKIVAKDGQVWGTLPISKEDITALKETIAKIDYSDREYLLEVLNNWEKGDFSHCVEEHNYFWNKLGGTIGEASKLKADHS